MTDFSERLDAAISHYQFFVLRRRESLTQEEIGALAGVGQSVAGKWLRGVVVPEMETLQKLATALHVDPGWLAFGPASRAPGPDRVVTPEPARVQVGVNDAELRRGDAPPQGKKLVRPSDLDQKKKGKGGA